MSLRGGRLVRGAALAAAHAAVLIVTLFVLGTCVHEGGHGIAATAGGARVTRAVILGWQVYPGLEKFTEGHGYYGTIWHARTPPEWVPRIAIAGSLATWLVSVVAVAAWSLWPPKRIPWGLGRTALLGCCAMGADVLAHTLPVVGLRMYLVFGGRRADARLSELYYGALEMGVPSWLVLTLVFAWPFVSLGLVGWRTWPAFRSALRSRGRSAPPPPADLRGRTAEAPSAPAP